MPGLRPNAACRPMAATTRALASSTPSCATSRSCDPRRAARSPAPTAPHARPRARRFWRPRRPLRPARARRGAVARARRRAADRPQPDDVDPRAVPTRAAAAIGARAAEAIVPRYVQDHGEHPRRIALDLWGSATMRTGGDDLAQALALLGVRPTWDHASNRVSGFEILPAARLDRPRIDVTLRISGLFRDVFATQIALFDEAVRAVAGLDEEDDNPLAAERRAGGRPRASSAPRPAFGAGITDLARGAWESRADLGRDYLAAVRTPMGAHSEGSAAPSAFQERVATADAFVHVQDMAGAGRAGLRRIRRARGRVRGGRRQPRRRAGALPRRHGLAGSARACARWPRRSPGRCGRGPRMALDRETGQDAPRLARRLGDRRDGRQPLRATRLWPTWWRAASST